MWKTTFLKISSTMGKKGFHKGYSVSVMPHPRAWLVLVVAVSSWLSVVPSPVVVVQAAARPSPPSRRSWGLISSWKGWKSSRRQGQRRQDVATAVQQQTDESLILSLSSDSLNYTAITILHVGKHDTSATSNKQDRSFSSIPQPGCLLEYSILTTTTNSKTRITNGQNNPETSTGSSSSWGSKWMPGSSSAWTAPSGGRHQNDCEDEDDAHFLALAQAAAMTSQVVVLVLSSSSSHSLYPKLVLALQAGFARRQEQAGLTKGSLVLVLNNNDGSKQDDDDIVQWRNALVLGDFNDMQPRHVHALELTSVGDYALTLEHLLREERMQIVEQDKNLVPLPAFPRLLQQTYSSLLLLTNESSQRQQSTTMAPTSNLLFDHDADCTLYTTTTTTITSEPQDSSSTTTATTTAAALPPLTEIRKAQQAQIVGGGQEGRTNHTETVTSLSAANDDENDDDHERVSIQAPVDDIPNAPAEGIVSTTIKTAADEKEMDESNKVILDAMDQHTTVSHGGADPAAVVEMELDSQIKAATTTTATVVNKSKFTDTVVPKVQQSDAMDDSFLEQYEQEQEAAKVLLATCHERLDALEQAMEQLWFDATTETDDDINDTNLNDDSSDESSSTTITLRPPPCDFAKAATPVLQELQQAFAASSLLSNNKQLQESVTATVGSRLSRLYQQHLQSLRDYHGKVYETMLDSRTNPAGNSKRGPWWRQRPFSRKRQRPTAARVEKDLQRTVQAFRKAAQEAVPPLTRRGSPFRDMDLDYVNSLQGLLADMQEAIALRESLIDLDKYDEDHDADDEAKRGGGLWGFIRRGRQQGAAATWYEKLAARAFVLLVNYLQGWLAWQALQRAALEREREMPKFPIF